MSFAANCRFETGAATHVGKVRDHNEDKYMVRPETGIWAVADGMGGHEAGEVASAKLIEALGSIDQPSSAADLLARCETSVLRANGELYELATERGRTMGTTLAVLLTFGGYYAGVWSGDSRIYRIRDGEISQISRDHTEAQALVDQGVLSPEEARHWPRRNVITRAIGIGAHPELDIEHGEIEADDIFVLCSDGLTGHLADGEIRELVISHRPQAACDALIDLTLARGATDNVTIIVVQCLQDDTTVIRPGRRAEPAAGASRN
jgi:serine/threonine protein phosphatase PrpC